MADPISFADADIELSFDNGATWDDASGDTNSVESDGGELSTEDTHVLNSNKAKVTFGKISSLSLTFRIIYDKTATSIYKKVNTAFWAKTNVLARIAPEGNTSGNDRFTFDAGKITSCPPPVGEAGNGAAVLIEFTLQTPGYTIATIAP